MSGSRIVRQSMKQLWTAYSLGDIAVWLNGDLPGHGASASSAAGGAEA